MLTPAAVVEAHRPTNRFIVAFGVLTFQVDAPDQPAAEVAAREQFRGVFHREPVVAPLVIDYAPLP